MSFTEGSVLIDVDMTSQTRPKVTTRSTRQGEISRAITGQPVNSLLPKTLIESLYALCPQAHLTAFECAMAAAQQKEIPQRTRKVVYEIINEHLRFLAFDACVSVGLKPAEEVRRLGQLRALTTAELSKEIPDFDRLDEAIAPAIQTFVTGSGPDQFEALQSLPDFEAWMMHGATAASRLYAQLWETVPCRRHTSVAMLNPRCSLETIETWISGDVSVSCPLINGTAHQTSALGRCENQPLLNEIAEQYGCGIRAQFVARLIDLMLYWKIRRDPQWSVQAGQTAPNTGLAHVQTARGSLIVRVIVEKGIIAGVKTIAPTEWNFASGSCAEQALSMIEFSSEDQWRRDAAWILTAIDPCVPYSIRFHNVLQNESNHA